MDGYVRYAIYYAPPTDHPLTAFGAAWLGWDAEAGKTRAHPRVSGLPRAVDDITATPRKYGFHGTLKPPFRLAEGMGVADLHAAVQALTATQPSVMLDGLQVAQLGTFVALVPEGETGPLAHLAATMVEALDGFRAPLTEPEIARRRKAPLSPRQATYLARWGYPYVMEDFRFHLTLTGALAEEDAQSVAAALRGHLAPFLGSPFWLRDVCLFGEGQDGRFHNLRRYPLLG